MSSLSSISSRLPFISFNGQIIRSGGNKRWSVNIALDSLQLRCDQETAATPSRISWKPPIPSVQKIMETFLAVKPGFLISKGELSLSPKPSKNLEVQFVLQGQYRGTSFAVHLYPHHPELSYGSMQEKKLSLDLSDVVYAITQADWQSFFKGQNPFYFRMCSPTKLKLLPRDNLLSYPNDAEKLAKFLGSLPEERWTDYNPFMEKMVELCIRSEAQFMPKFSEILPLWHYLPLEQKKQLGPIFLSRMRKGDQSIRHLKIFYGFLQGLKEDKHTDSYLAGLDLDKSIDLLLKAPIADISSHPSWIQRLRLAYAICEVLFLFSCQVSQKDYALLGRTHRDMDLGVRYWQYNCNTLLKLVAQGQDEGIRKILKGLSKVDFGKKPKRDDRLLRALKQVKINVENAVKELSSAYASLIDDSSFPEIFVLRQLVKDYPELLLNYEWIKALVKGPSSTTFLFGYVALLGDDLLLKNDIDLSLAKQVVELLQYIREENGSSSQSPSPLQSYIDACLQKATQHRQSAVQKLARASLSSTLSLKAETLEETENVEEDLFNVAFPSSAPMDWLIKHGNRDKDFGTKFIMESPYYVDPKAQESLQASKMADAHIDEFLRSASHKVLLVTGPAGGGKSMYVKHFFEKQLAQYADGASPYLPLFFSLARLTQINNLKDECLKSNLQQPVEFERVFKMKTVWIFDGYDEIPFQEIGNRIQIKNLYLLNSLMHIPSAKFIFTCREGFCTTDFFEPERGALMQHLKISPFESSTGDLGAYIDTYLSRRTKDQHQKWAQKEYYEAIEALLPSLAPSLTKPHLLRVFVHALPSIMERLERTYDLTRRQILNNARHLEQLTQEIYDVFTCASIERAFRRQVGNPNLESISKMAFFWYALTVAHAMQLSGQANLSLQEAIKDARCAEAIEEVYKLIPQGELPLDKNDFFGQTVLAILFRTSTLGITRGNYWTFADPGHFQHLVSVIKKNRIQALKEAFINDPYAIKSLVLFV